MMKYSELSSFIFGCAFMAVFTSIVFSIAAYYGLCNIVS